MADLRGRSLPARVLIDLLTSPPTSEMVDWHGVRIVNAIVTGPLDLQNADVPYVTDLEHCDFTGDVNLSQSTFLKGLFVNRSWFVSVNFDHATINGQFDASNAVFFDERPHETRFNAMKVLGDSIVNHTTFWGPADFRQGSVGGLFDARGAVFDEGAAYNITDAAFRTNTLRTMAVHVAPAVHVTNFDSLAVAGNAKFIDAQFYGPMSLNYAAIGGQLDASSAIITGTAEFNTVDVKGDADFNWTSFRGPVSFCDGTIGGQFHAIAAAFSGTMTGPRCNTNDAPRSANFNSLTVGGSAFFSSAAFTSTVDFAYMTVDGQLHARHATFIDPTQGVDFTALKVGGSADFLQARFEGPVSFCDVGIGGSFDAVEAQFIGAKPGSDCNNGPTNSVSFNTMSVGGNAYFNAAMFTNAVDFAQVSVGGQLQASATRFDGPLNLTNARLLSLVITRYGTIPRRPPGQLRNLDLSHTVIGGVLRVEDEPMDNLLATALHVAGPASFNGLTITSTSAFTGSSFQTVAFSGVTWMAPPDFGGMTYQYMQVVGSAVATGGTHTGRGASWFELPGWLCGGTGKVDGPLRSLLDVVNQADYNAADYDNLEAFDQQQGHPMEADKVFAAQQLRYRCTTLPLTAPSNWFPYAQSLWGSLDNYGRNPEQLLPLVAALLALGTLMFRRGNMTTTGPTVDPNKLPPYNSLWYCVGLIVPTDHLKITQEWTPKRDNNPIQRMVRGYKTLVAYGGKALVSIVLLAFTGVIK